MQNVEFREDAIQSCFVKLQSDFLCRRGLVIDVRAIRETTHLHGHDNVGRSMQDFLHRPVISTTEVVYHLEFLAVYGKGCAIIKVHSLGVQNCLA